MRVQTALLLVILVIACPPAAAQDPATAFSSSGIPLIFEQSLTAESLFGFRSRGLQVSVHADATVGFHLEPGNGQNEASFRMKFLGADPATKIQGELPVEGGTIYITDRALEPLVVPSFHRIRFRSVYPGIDVVFYGIGRDVEYDVEADPGADLSQVRIAFEGAHARLADGHIVIHAGDRRIQQSEPVAYEVQSPGHRQPAQCSYSLRRGVLRFQARTRNPEAKLVIDPILNFSSMIGGSGFDAVRAIKTDNSGYLYLAGETDSTEVQVPSANTLRRPDRNGWVVKLDRYHQIVYKVLFGGTGEDVVNAIDIDRRGNAYAAGTTSSNSLAGFTGSALGLEDAFVFKLDAAGAFKWGTYIGGASSDSGWAIAVMPDGAAILAGQTSSTILPAASTGYQKTNGGGASDCFLSKVVGGVVTNATYLGGSALDLCRAVAITPDGQVVVTGSTASFNFPTRSAWKPLLGGNTDAFLAWLSSDLASLAASTYIGGIGVDDGYALAADALGALYVGGSTTSLNFTVTGDAVQSLPAGGYDGFLMKFAAGTQTPSYSTLLGGSGEDVITALAVDRNGRVAISGYSLSANLPSRDSAVVYAGSFDAFAGILNPGSATEFLTYLGGSGDDRASAVAFCAAYTLCVGGQTESSAFPVTNAATARDFDGFFTRVTTAAATAGSATRALVWEDPAYLGAVAAFLGGTQGISSLGAVTITGLDPSGWRLAGAADFNGDGFIDLVWQHSNGQANVSYMSGTRGTDIGGWNTISTQVTADWILDTVADLNRDGKPDAIWRNATTGAVEVRYMGGPAGNSVLSTVTLGSRPGSTWSIVGAGDFDSDGFVDLVWQDSVSKSLLLWYLSGPSGNLIARTLSVHNVRFPYWSVSGIKDVDGDSKPDMVWTDDATGDATVALMSGTNGTTVTGWSPTERPPFPGWRVRAVR